MKDLARIEDIVRIERLLDLPHKIDGTAELLLEKRHLSLSYPMLTGACPIHRQSPLIEPRHETFRNGDTFGRLVVEQQQHVKVPVPRMTDDRRQQTMFLDVGLRLGNTIRKP